MKKLILYDKFDINCKNPVAILHNAYNVKIIEKLNAEYRLIFNNPKDTKSKYLKEENYIKCENQIFKIKKIEQVKGIKGIDYQVECEHVFYEMLDDYIHEASDYLNTPQQIAEKLMLYTDFSISVEGTFEQKYFSISRGNPIKTIQRMLEKWDLELHRDNRNVILKSAINAEKIQLFRTGKNIDSFKRVGSTESITTRLHLIGKEGLTFKGLDISTIPYYYEIENNVATFYNNSIDKVIQFKANVDIVDGITVLKDSYIDSKYITDYPKIKNDERLNEEIEDKLELLLYGLSELQKIEEKIENFEVSVVELYKTKGDIERFGLGWTVILQDKDILQDKEQNKILARITEYEYYPYEFNNSTVKIGFYNDNVLGFLGELQKTKKKVQENADVWDKIFSMIDDQGTISAQWLNNRIANAGDMIKFGQGNVIADNRGLMVLDTDSINTAKAIIIMTTNNSKPILGIAERTNTVEDFVYRTALDSKGINADEIVTGTLKTSLVKIYGDTHFYWDTNGLYIGNPNNTQQYIKLDKEGFRFTTDGGQTWVINIGFGDVNVSTKQEVETAKQEAVDQSKSYIDGQITNVNNSISNLETNFNNAFSDSQITKIEANNLKTNLVKANAESINLINIASSLNITTEKTEYEVAINNLNTELNNWIDQVSYPLSITTVQRDKIKTLFEEVEKKKTNLINAITTKQSSNAETNAKDYTDTEISKIPQPDLSLYAPKVFYNGLLEISDTKGFVAYKDSSKKEFTQLYPSGLYRVMADGTRKSYHYLSYAGEDTTLDGINIFYNFYEEWEKLQPYSGGGWVTVEEKWRWANWDFVSDPVLGTPKNPINSITDDVINRISSSNHFRKYVSLPSDFRYKDYEVLIIPDFSRIPNYVNVTMTLDDGSTDTHRFTVFEQKTLNSNHLNNTQTLDSSQYRVYINVEKHSYGFDVNAFVIKIFNDDVWDEQSSTLAYSISRDSVLVTGFDFKYILNA